jgi:hypothetical protein
MSEFAREAVLGQVNAGGTSKMTLEGDLVTLTGRLHELDRLLKTLGSLLAKVLGERGGEPREQGGGGVAG